MTSKLNCIFFPTLTPSYINIVLSQYLRYDTKKDPYSGPKQAYQCSVRLLYLLGSRVHLQGGKAGEIKGATIFSVFTFVHIMQLYE